MSAKIMGEVWGLDMPREQKYVLVALADHADHEGNHVYPSVGLIAWKTDYSERQVRRILTQLEAAGAIVPVDRQSGQTTEYRIDLSSAPRKASRIAKRGRPANTQISTAKTPDILTQGSKTPDIAAQNPGHFDTATPDILTQNPGHFDSHLYECARVREPSLEPSLEPIPPKSPQGDGVGKKSVSKPQVSKPQVSKPAFSQDFLDLWARYPQIGRLRGGKTEAQAFWDKLPPDKRQSIAAALENALQFSDFAEKFAPALLRWLKGKYEPYAETVTPPTASKQLSVNETTPGNWNTNGHSSRYATPAARTIPSNYTEAVMGPPIWKVEAERAAAAREQARRDRDGSAGRDGNGEIEHNGLPERLGTGGSRETSP